MLAAAAFIAACNAPTQAPLTPTPSSPTSPPPPPPTAGPATILLARTGDGPDPSFEDLLADLRSLTSDAGLTLVESPDAAPTAAPGTKAVILYAPAADATAYALQNPTLQIIAIGPPATGDAPNLLTIGPGGFAWEQQGFAAGFAAALATPAYRVGALSPQGLPQAESAAAAFRQGAIYYCGLCNPVDPPYLDYPLIVPVAADGSDLAAGFAVLASAAVRTVYVPDPALGDAALPLAAEKGMQLVGPRLGDPALASAWLASVRADPSSVLRDEWPNLMNGLLAGSRPMSLRFGDAHPDSLTPGKLAFLAEFQTSLETGLISTATE